MTFSKINKLIFGLVFSLTLLHADSFGLKPSLRIIRFKTQGLYFHSPPDSFFISLENKWLKALQMNDTAFLDHLLDADFIDISYKGTIRTKADVLSSGINNSLDITQRLKDMKVRRYKWVAIVTGINNIVVKNTETIYIRFTDVFIKKDKKWYAISAQETLQK